MIFKVSGLLIGFSKGIVGASTEQYRKLMMAL